MPAILLGKKNQISKNLDIDTSEELTKSAIDKFLAAYSFNENEKKTYKALAELLQEYYKSFNKENTDRVSRLKATILSEYSSLLDFFKKIIEGSESDKKLPSISDIKDNIEKYFTELDKNNTKLEKKFTDISSYAIADLMSALTEIFYKQGDVHEKLLKEIKEQNLRYKSLKENAERLQKINEEYRKLLKKNRIDYKTEKDKAIELANKDIEKSNREYQKTLKKEQKLLTGNLNSISTKLLNQSENYQLRLNQYYKKYLEFSLAFKYKAGQFEIFTRKFANFATALTNKLKQTGLYRGISRSIISTKNFVKRITKSVSVSRLWRRFKDSYYVYKPYEWLTKNCFFAKKVRSAIEWTKTTAIPYVQKAIRHIKTKIKNAWEKLKARIMRYQKFMKIASGIFSFILAPVALVGGVLFKAIGITINLLVKSIFFAINALVKGIGLVVKFVGKVFKWGIKLTKSILGPVINTIQNAITDMADIAKRTVTTLLVSFFSTPVGAYAFGYALGYLWETLQNKQLKNFAKEKYEDIGKLISEELTKVKNTIKESKIYKSIERFRTEYGDTLVSFYYNIRSFLFHTYDWLILQRNYEKIKNAFIAVGSLVGLRMDYVRTFKPMAIGFHWIKNAKKMAKFSKRISRVTKVASKLGKGTIGKIIQAILVAAVVGGAAYLGYTQNPELENNNTISIQDGFKRYYNVDFGDSNGFIGTAKNIDQIVKGNPSKYSPDKILKLKRLHGIIGSEVESIEALRGKVDTIQKAYEEEFDGKRDQSSMLAFNSYIASGQPELRLANLFQNNIDEIMTSPLFGAIDYRSILKNIDNQFILKTTNTNSWSVNPGSIVDNFSGQDSDAYFKWEFINDIAFLNSILNFRSRQLEPYITAFMDTNTGSEQSVDNLLRMSEGINDRFQQNLAHLTNNLKGVAWNHRFNGETSIEDFESTIPIGLGSLDANNVFQQNQIKVQLKSPNPIAVTSANDFVNSYGIFTTERVKTGSHTVKRQGETFHIPEYENRLKITLDTPNARNEYIRYVKDTAFMYLNSYQSKFLEQVQTSLNSYANIGRFRENLDLAYISYKDKVINTNIFDFKKIGLDLSSPLALTQSVVRKAYDEAVEKELRANITEEDKRLLEQTKSKVIDINNIVERLKSLNDTKILERLKILVEATDAEGNKFSL